ncbi:hypothetical protein GCM10023319_28390 [Nocardia iowensis]
MAHSVVVGIRELATVEAMVMAVTACCPVNVRPGSQETTQRSPPTHRAMCVVSSLVIIDAETTSIATDVLPSC